MAVLHNLTEPEAIDEIGIGTIRDGLANILFPGTSTFQTRAKYFLLVLYILMELEKEAKLDEPKKLLDQLSEIEIELSIKLLISRQLMQELKASVRSELKKCTYLMVRTSLFWSG